MCVWHEEKRILSLPETNDGRVKVVVLYALILQNSTPLGHRSDLVVGTSDVMRAWMNSVGVR